MGDGATADEDGAEPGALSRAVRRVAEVVRRCPVTTGTIVAMVVIGLATGAFTNSVESSGLLETVGYGPPALKELDLLGFVLGMFFAIQPYMYATIIGVVAVFAGSLEWRAGPLRTALVLYGTQLASTLIAAALLLVLAGHGWSWADRVSDKLDVGFSAGAFGCALAMTAFLSPRWRFRLRVGLFTYLVLFLLYIGLIWDVEHLIAALIGLGVGPAVAGRAREPFRRPRTTKREVRLLLAFVVATTAVVQLLDLAAAGQRGLLAVRPTRAADTGSAFAIVVTSVLLLVLAEGIRRGRRVAWIALLVVLAATIVFNLLGPLDAQQGIALVLEVGVLIGAAFAHASFRAAPEPRTLKRTVFLVVGVLVALVAYSAIGFRVLRSSFEPRPDLSNGAREVLARLYFSSTDEFRPTSTVADWFVSSIGLIWVAAVVAVVVVLVFSSKQTRFPADRATAIDVIRQHGGGNTSWMTTWEGNTYWATETKSAYVAYRVIGSVCLVMGDPVGSEDGCLEAINEFRRFCFRRGWIPCWYGVTGRYLERYHEMGWQTVQVGEDTVIELAELEFKGKSWQDVRTAINKAGREGIRLESIHYADAPHAITDQLRQISDEWAGDKSLPEMGFTLGTLREAEDPDVRMTIAIDEAGSVHGMTSWLPVYRDCSVVGWTVDIMRRRFDGFRSVMEFLIASSAVQFKEEGFEFISLSAAPLAKADRTAGDDAGEDEEEALSKLLDVLADKMEPYYGFKSLLAFKKKFKPHFDPVYLVYPDAVALGSIGQAIGKAYLPHLSARDVVNMVKSGRSD